jgi:hypothetical protein
VSDRLRRLAISLDRYDRLAPDAVHAAPGQ